MLNVWGKKCTVELKKKMKSECQKEEKVHCRERERPTVKERNLSVPQLVLESASAATAWLTMGTVYLQKTVICGLSWLREGEKKNLNGTGARKYSTNTEIKYQDEQVQWQKQGKINTYVNKDGWNLDLHRKMDRRKRRDNHKDMRRQRGKQQTTWNVSKKER